MTERTNEGALGLAEFDHLRAVAQAAMTGHTWEWSARGEHGYPQQVISQGDAVLVAECYESPDFPSAFAEFIATFDPPTVLALLDAVPAHPNPESPTGDGGREGVGRRG